MNVVTGAAFSNPANKTVDNRVVGGVGVEIEDYPYMAQFRMHTIAYCGAAILNEFYLVTAAHCFQY